MGVNERFAHLPPLPEGTLQRLGSLKALLAHHPVRLAYLFGSSAQGSLHPRDVDLAAAPDSGFSWRDLYADLSLYLGTDRIDLVDLRAAPPEFRFEVVRSGRCVYACSIRERERYERHVRMQFRDDLPRLRMKQEALHARLGR